VKLLLINPPLVRTETVQPPLGLCALAYRVQRSGHSCEILDLDLELLLADDYSIEKALEIAADRIQGGSQIRCVAITSMYNNSVIAHAIVEHLKSIDPGLFVVAGGPHFGAVGKIALENIPELDAVIEGEGEEALVGLLNSIEANRSLADVPNIVYRVNDEIVKNSDAPLINLENEENIWPVIAQIIDLKAYADTDKSAFGSKSVFVEAGRGCPFRCSFCAPAQFWKRQYRVKRPSVIAAEIAFLHDNYGYGYFQLVHDLLFANKNFIIELCKALVERNVEVAWMANSRFDLELEDVYELASVAGCNKLFFGVESASTEIQKLILKDLCVEDIPAKVKKLSDTGIASTCSFVIGLPQESGEQISATIALGARLRLSGAEIVQFHRLRLFPPAPIAKESTAATFDMRTLKLEYPFHRIRDRELNRIRNIKPLYLGYFAPSHPLYSDHVLTQAELFFQQAVAIAPLSILFVCNVLAEQLFDVFSEWASETQGIEQLDLSNSVGDNALVWQNIRPALAHLVECSVARKSDYRAFAKLLDIEEKRVLHVEERAISETLREARSGFSVEIDFSLADTIRRFRDAHDLVRPTGLKELIIYQWDEMGNVSTLVAS
jgi:radical SAM superfamily enzyme YgiQ (UPF0313 family)